MLRYTSRIALGITLTSWLNIAAYPESTIIPRIDPPPEHVEVSPIVATSEVVVVRPKRKLRRVVAAPPPSSVEHWRPLLEKYDGWNVDQMLSVMACESKGNPNAVNEHSGAAGLMQIHPPTEDALDPERNVAIAHHKWKTQGIGAWKECL